MNSKFFIAVVVVSVSLIVLIYTAVAKTSQAVVTVEELVSEGVSRQNVRLGARVADSEIKYQTEPSFMLQFLVRDIHQESRRIPVVYKGVMPDTLKTGRDVILDGNFDGQQFVASSLLTQCPSKYEPPKPGA